MDKPLTVEYAKEIGTAFIQTYYQSFDNGPRENLSALYVNKRQSLFDKFGKNEFGIDIDSVLLLLRCQTTKPHRCLSREIWSKANRRLSTN